MDASGLDPLQQESLEGEARVFEEHTCLKLVRQLEKARDPIQIWDCRYQIEQQEVWGIQCAGASILGEVISLLGPPDFEPRHRLNNKKNMAPFPLLKAFHKASCCCKES